MNHGAGDGIAMRSRARACANKIEWIFVAVRKHSDKDPFDRKQLQNHHLYTIFWSKARNKAPKLAIYTLYGELAIIIRDIENMACQGEIVESAAAPSSRTIFHLKQVANENDWSISSSQPSLSLSLSLPLSCDG